MRRIDSVDKVVLEYEKTIKLGPNNHDKLYLEACIEIHQNIMNYATIFDQTCHFICSEPILVLSLITPYSGNAPIKKEFVTKIKGYSLSHFKTKESIKQAIIKCLDNAFDSVEHKCKIRSNGKYCNMDLVIQEFDEIFDKFKSLFNKYPLKYFYLLETNSEYEKNFIDKLDLFIENFIQDCVFDKDEYKLNELCKALKKIANSLNTDSLHFVVLTNDCKSFSDIAHQYLTDDIIKDKTSISISVYSSEFNIYDGNVAISNYTIENIRKYADIIIVAAPKHCICYSMNEYIKLIREVNKPIYISTVSIPSNNTLSENSIKNKIDTMIKYCSEKELD